MPIAGISSLSLSIFSAFGISGLFSNPAQSILLALAVVLSLVVLISFFTTRIIKIFF